MKKLMAGVLMGAILVSSVQAVSATEEWLTYGNGKTAVRYSTYTGTIKRADGTTSAQDHPSPVKIDIVSIDIPTKINGTEIVAVEKNGFFDFDELGSIGLPSTLTTLGDNAFSGADNLKKVEIPAKVAAVSKACFKSCDSLSSVQFGAGVREICDQAFHSCKSLTSVSLNSGCKTLGLSAFEGCSKLKNIELPAGLEKISSYAFKDCTALTDITIPKGVTIIDTNTFVNCTSLKTVRINGNITKIDKNAFKGCSELTDIYIPASCKKIESNAFDGCKKLRIHCPKGSAADNFAQSNKISVVNGNDAINPTTVPNKITVVLDGNEINFNGVEPQIVNGCTMVPMRAIFEELDCVMNWDNVTKTVTASKRVTNIKLTVGKKRAYINGKENMLDAAPCIVNGTTLVPVRFVSEALGVDVKWDQATRTVNLISK